MGSGGRGAVCSQACGWEQGGRDERRGEAEEVEGDEEEFVEGAEGEEDDLPQTNQSADDLWVGNEDGENAPY